MKITLFLGNCNKISIEDESIDLIVTSPPYHVGKEYEGDVGNDVYASMMTSFYSTSYVRLKPGGYIVINFGDMHNSNNRLYNAEVPATYPASASHWFWGRMAGFDLQAARIWKKHHARVGMGYVCNIRPRHSFDFEHVWTWRKPGNDGEEWVNDRSLSQRGVLGENWKSPANLGVHCAAFPVELPDWAIRVYTNDDTRINSVVCDPFMGSGTTCIAAFSNNCGSFIGIEKNITYMDIARERIYECTGVKTNYV